MTEISPQVKTFLLGLSVSIIVLASFFAGAVADRVFVIKPLNYFLGERASLVPSSSENGTTSSPLSSLLQNSQTVADIAEVSSRAVVTVSVKKEQRVIDPLDQGIFGFGFRVPGTGKIEEIKRDIGTGFVAGKSGLIVTNKHVVGDPNAEYSVIDKDDKEYKVINIYRDPSNDLAILKVEGAQLPELPLGDSDKIRVGQEVIAIGTALGEFRHTVTTGVVSGLGRGIEATDGYGFESLEGVIQTDAAINPGNSGGPLLDQAGSVIGVNVAVSAGAENIGFAIPINVVKASLDNFNRTGQFDRPFMDIRYRNISEQAALLNDVPQGAYLLEVVEGSSAAEAGLQEGDIVTEFDGKKVKDDNNELSKLINEKRVGDTVKVKYWREGSEQSIDITLKKST